MSLYKIKAVKTVKATDSQYSNNVSSIKQKSSCSFGKVALVGAGPGDPDLLTVKALRSIEQADVIIFDNLVSEAIRELFPVHSETLYVGKAKGAHSSTQDEINQLLIEKAKLGLNICRLKC